MNKFCLTCMLLLCATTAMAGVQFDATVDRDQLYQGESLYLTLQLKPADSLQEPDIQPLKQDYHLLGSRQQFLQQDGVSVRRWIFRLSPKHEEASQIPALQLGQLHSRAIPIRILPSPRFDGSATDSFFIQTSLNKQQVYLHEQSILRLRVYHSTPFFSGARLQHLEMPGARVEQLGELHSSEQVINGRQYSVVEASYAIYPLQSGELEIPAIEFSAIPIREDPALLQAGILEPDSEIRLTSEPMFLQVLPPPEQFPADASWLPATALNIRQSWSPEDAIHTEQALTRSLELEATGLPASLLPRLLPAQQQHFEVFPSPASQTEHISNSGITSQQIELQALVANAGGSYLIPAQQLPWWNTEKDQLEYALLPEKLIRVQDPAFTARLNSSTDVQFWQAVSFLLGLGNLVFIALWRMAKRKPSAQQASASNNSRLLDNLRRACKNNNPVQARNAIDALARSASMTPSDAARLSPEFALALTELNTVLYTNNDYSIWLGDNLWHSVSSMRRFSDNQNSDSLPPLYPP